MLLPVARGASSDDKLAGSARELAAKIAASLGAGEPLALTVRNISSLPESGVIGVRSALEEELRRRGVRLEAGAGTTAAVTLSENFQSCIWVAQIARGEKRDVVIVAAPRLPVAGESDNPPPVVLEKKLLLVSDKPILDLAIVENGLLALEPGMVSLYRRQGPGWERAQSVMAGNGPALPRDPRGRLIVEGDLFQAYLPGTTCSGTIQPALRVECKEGSQWPLEIGTADFAAGRNYFTKENLPSFFSIAGVAEQGNTLWIVAGVDGRVHLYDKELQPAGTLDGWGGDLAGVETECGSGKHTLVIRSTDSGETDNVEAVEIVNRHAVTASSSLELPGPVTALWQAANKRTAVAVARNTKTGQYEAFSLAISCSR